MIKNGYYYPVEALERLKHMDLATGEIAGDANVFICAGNRTAGKTVGIAIKMLIEGYEKRGERGLLLARTEKQKLGGYLEKWWFKTLNIEDNDGIIPAFKAKHEITFTRDYMLVDGDIMCYCEAISQSHLVKDMGSYDHCTKIIMDEAVQGGESTLQINGRGAMDRIFEIWQTVARGWKYAVACTNLIFIMNTSERNNWLFNDLRINTFLRADTKKTCHRGIYIEIINNKTASKEVDASGMAEIMKNSISGARYYEAAQENKFQDNTAFISPIGLDFANLKIQLLTRDHCLGVFSRGAGWHIAKIEPDSRSGKICKSEAVHKEDTVLEYFGQWEISLKRAYAAGLVTFQTLESKALFEEFLHS